MKVKVTITNELNELWATEEELATMTDAEIIELIQEDTIEFLAGASWTLERINNG